MTAHTIEAATWRRTDQRLKFSLGGVLLGAVRFPAITLDAAFLWSANNDSLAVYPSSLPDNVRATVVYSQPVQQPLKRISLEASTVRYVRSHYRRFIIVLNETYTEYEKRLSARRRKHLHQMMRKFTCASGGTIDWREYRLPSDMPAFHSLARQISQITYQEKLVDAGLPATEAFQRELTELAERDSVRGYILFLDRKPIAYEYCPSAGEVITCERVGYDPEYRQHSPGLVLLLLTIERLLASKQFEIFDFGRGEFSYKETLATSSIPCADIYYFRKSISNFVLVLCHASLEVCAKTVSSVSEKLGLRQKLKKLLRAHYGTK